MEGPRERGDGGRRRAGADDALFDLVQKSHSTFEQQQFFEAMRELRRQRGGIEQRYRAAVAKLQGEADALRKRAGTADRQRWRRSARERNTSLRWVQVPTRISHSGLSFR